MSLRVFVASTIAGLLWTSTAKAVSITNRDDKDFKVTIIEAAGKQDNVLKPGEVIEGVCQKGCVIRLNDKEDSDYELEGSDAVSIEDGYLYYEDSGKPAPPKSGAVPLKPNSK
jgi:hypothetical protein